MYPKAFLCYLRYCFGLPVYHDRVVCPVCQRPMDVLGHHALKCAKCHNLIRDHFAEFARKGCLGPKVEVLGLLGDGSCPADVYLPSFPGGPACCNFTVICTNQARLLTGLVDDCQYAVKDSER